MNLGRLVQSDDGRKTIARRVNDLTDDGRESAKRDEWNEVLHLSCEGLQQRKNLVKVLGCLVVLEQAPIKKSVANEKKEKGKENGKQGRAHGHIRP